MMGYFKLVFMTWLVTLVTAYDKDSCIRRVNNGCTLNLSASSLTVLPTNMNENTCTIVACHNKLTVLSNTTFSSTGNLEVIVLRYNEIHTLETGTFRSLRKLQDIDLGYNRIEYLDESVFWYTNLYKLNLEHNSISNIIPNMMAHATFMWQLIIGSNKITKLHPHTFSNTSYIVDIDISRNGVSELDSKIFQKNERIARLDLSGNMISGLHHDIFKSVQLLMRLNMSHNKIVSLEANLFSSNMHLQNLDLSNNAIEHVDTDIFKNNTKLEILNMSNNELSSLNSDIFSHNVAITSVDISCNNIHYIHPETFRVNKQLSSLNVRKNRLASLDERIFFHNNKLKIIDFSNNQIVTIPPNIFTTNTKIQSINLSTNRITQIFPGTFDANKIITDVDLSHNMIKVLDNNMFSETKISTLNLRGNRLTMKGDDIPLLRAPLLEKLDLGSCGITILPPKTFQHMLGLKELMLDNNYLQLPHEPDSENNIFSNLHQLSKLDLSSNEITVMNSHLLYDMNNLKLLNLSFNPAVCDDCERDGKDVWIWCSERSVRCVSKCNLGDKSVSQRSCISTTSVSEVTSHSRANTTSLNILHRREDLKAHNKMEEAESGNPIAMEQDHSLTIYIILGVGLPLIVIGVVLAIIIKRRRSRSNGEYL
jgi:Leucine-rich repeat (LRR) protein